MLSVLWSLQDFSSFYSPLAQPRKTSSPPAFLGQPEEQHSHYPDDIWAYLNSALSGAAASQANRKEQMLAGWAAAGRIGSPDSAQWKRRIALLTSTNAADKDLNVELMNERAAMLADIPDQVSLMKCDLADLLRSLKP